MNAEKIIARLDKEKAALDALLAPLTQEQIGAPSTAETWSLKDHIAHLTAYAAGMVALLHGQSRSVAMGLTPEIVATTRGDDAINAILYRQHAADTVEQVLTAFDSTHDQFTEVLRQIGNEGLAKPYNHYAPENKTKTGQRPVEGWVLGNGAAHYAKHRGWMQTLIAQKGWA